MATNEFEGAGWLGLSEQERAEVRQAYSPELVLSRRYGFPVDTCRRAIIIMGVTEAENTLRIACEYEVTVAQVEFGLERQEKK